MGPGFEGRPTRSPHRLAPPPVSQLQPSLLALQPLPHLPLPLNAPPPRTTRFDAPPQDFLDAVQLDRSTGYYLWVGIGETTRSSYAKAQSAYREWASAGGNIPFPTDSKLLSRWAAHLAVRGLRPGSIRGSLAGLRSFHTDAGLDASAFDCTQLARVLRGIRRDAGAAERRLRLPITLPILARILQSLKSISGVSDRDRSALSAAYAIAYVGAFRSGELTYNAGEFDPSFSCSRSDFLDKVSYGVIRLPSSKTDPYRKGVDIVIPSAPPGAVVDPLNLLRAHLANSPAAASSPLFFRAGKYPFAFQKSWFVDTLRRTIAASGLDSKHFSGHSFRRGLATWAKISSRLGDDDIRLLGRWSSNAVCLYQEKTPEQVAAISRGTLLAAPNAPDGIVSHATSWWGDE